MSRFILTTLLFLTFVILSLQMDCTDPNISNIQLEDDILNIPEIQLMGFSLSDSFINCLAHDVYPYNYSFVGFSVSFVDGSSNFRYIRVVYSCSGGSFGIISSLSESTTTAISGTDPIFLNSDYLREDCYSCDANMPSNTYLCEECNASCLIPNTTLGFCFGPSLSECCRYTHNNICVAECPGGFTPNSNNTCVCIASCANGSLNSTCQCECTPDYFGVRCENQFLPCDTNPCLNGTCIDGVGDMVYACDCLIGFNGTNCETNIDECATNPCTPGGCIDGINSYSCSCPFGYSLLGNITHPNCTYTNECDLNPCQNMGNCSDFIGGYNCSCRVPYTGTNCSDCSINSCGNGTNINCSCVCYLGHFGEFCESDINDCITIPCLHSGVCIDGNGTYTCDCSGTYHEGVNCENIANNCIPDPCIHGQCNSSIGNYTCTCDGNYTGKNCSNCEITCNNGGTVTSGCSCDCSDNGFEGERCENDINECLLSPCVNNGTCQNTIGNYTCTCDGNYTGSNCSNCEITCDNGGTVTSGCSCDCSDTGFEGERCENDINECLLSPCVNNGTCQNTIENYTCNCSLGFEGVNCENITNNCIPDPCIHGQCNSSIGNYTCTCDGNYTGRNCSNCEITCDNGGTVTPGCSCDCSDNGFEGERCENDINECLLSPCVNNGTCQNTIGNYTCNCSLRFEGVNCENITNNCIPDPCIHGQCNNSIWNYTCTCDGNYTGSNCSNCEITCNNGGTVTPGCSCDCSDNGFEGERCENDINECLLSPCVNNGTCQNTIGNYTCNCSLRFEGVNCENITNNCIPDPCIHGQCNNSIWNYTCTCDGNYTGRNCSNCEITCDNGGSVTSGCSCDCSDTGFEGERCENDINECLLSPCINNGTCQNTIGNYTCNCSLGFEGVNCEKDINECNTFPCINGDCINTPGSFSCNCSFGFNGSLCENAVTDCSYASCQNGGTCMQRNSSIYCHCLSSYTGISCESKLCQDGEDRNGDMCVNINECKKYTNICGVFPANCTDNIPLYTCGCPDGYDTMTYSSQLNYCTTFNCSPKLCMDIDECSLGIHSCHATQECVNTNGSYICICPVGVQQKGNMCVQSVVSPDCPMRIDSSGLVWPGVSRGSVVRLKCVNSYYSIAERICYYPCECSVGTYWGLPDLSACRSVGLMVLMADLESLDTFREFNGVTFKETVNSIRVYATTNQILAEDIRTLLLLFHKIVENIGKLNTNLLDRNLFMNVLRIADVLLATTPDAWNEVGNTFEDVLKLHDSIIDISHQIAKYLYSNNSEFEFNFNSVNIQLHLITFHNYTININDYNDYKPTTDYILLLPTVNTDILNLPFPQTPESCQVFIQTLYLPTFHHLLHSNQQSLCGETVTQLLIYPTPLFTFGVHSVLCYVNIANLSSPFSYKVNSSKLTYSISEALYSLQAVTNYSHFQHSNSFAPSSCQGPMEDLGYFVFDCKSIIDNFLTLLLPSTEIPFYASIIGILLRILLPLSTILSLIGLALLFTRYIVLVDGMAFVRMNVILTLVFSQILFVIGIDRNESQIVCMVLRFLLYYLSITTIIWSLIDIINVCIITIFDSYRDAINLTYLIAGYISPLAPIVITMSLSFCSYSRNSFFCLPTAQTSENAIWYILTPLFVLLFVYVCLVVLVVIILGYKRKNIRVELMSDFKLLIRIILSSFLLPLLVFAFWIWTLLAYSTDEPYFIFQVVSLVTGTSIGMFILFIYVIASAEEFKPTKSGRKEEETKAFTHIAMERITFNPLFKDSQGDVHSIEYTGNTVIANSIL